MRARAEIMKGMKKKEAKNESKIKLIRLTYFISGDSREESILRDSRHLFLQRKIECKIILGKSSI